MLGDLIPCFLRVNGITFKPVRDMEMIGAFLAANGHGLNSGCTRDRSKIPTLTKKPLPFFFSHTYRKHLSFIRRAAPMVHSPVHWNPLNCARRRFDGWVSSKPTSIRGSVWTAQLTKETMRGKKGGPLDRGQSRTEGCFGSNGRVCFLWGPPPSKIDTPKSRGLNQLPYFRCVFTLLESNLAMPLCLSGFSYGPQGQIVHIPQFIVRDIHEVICGVVNSFLGT